MTRGPLWRGCLEWTVIPDDEDNGTTLFGNWPAGFVNDYQLFDIAALQYLYGPPPGQRDGDDIYTLNPGAFDPSGPQGQWPLLWDGAGFDTLDFSGFSVSLNISLVPGELSRIGGAGGGILDPGVFSINYRTVIEAVIGGTGDDVLRGNSADNVLRGGAGNGEYITNHNIAFASTSWRIQGTGDFNADGDLGHERRGIAPNPQFRRGLERKADQGNRGVRLGLNPIIPRARHASSCRLRSAHLRRGSVPHPAPGCV